MRKFTATFRRFDGKTCDRTIMATGYSEAWAKADDVVASDKTIKCALSVSADDEDERIGAFTRRTQMEDM